MRKEELYEKGEELRAASCFREAVLAFQKALEVTPSGDGAFRLLVLKRLGDCLRMVGAFEEAKKNLC